MSTRQSAIYVGSLAAIEAELGLPSGYAEDMARLYPNDKHFIAPTGDGNYDLIACKDREEVKLTVADMHANWTGFAAAPVCWL